MSDEKVTENPKPNDELSNKTLDKVQGGAFNGFANFGDIKGESTDKDHKDWVTILQFNHSITQPQ
jgi:type VI protein secretion system component Hcp